MKKRVIIGLVVFAMAWGTTPTLRADDHRDVLDLRQAASSVRFSVESQPLAGTINLVRYQAPDFNRSFLDAKAAYDENIKVAIGAGINVPIEAIDDFPAMEARYAVEGYRTGRVVSVARIARVGGVPSLQSDDMVESPNLQLGFIVNRFKKWTSGGSLYIVEDDVDASSTNGGSLRRIPLALLTRGDDSELSFRVPEWSRWYDVIAPEIPDAINAVTQGPMPDLATTLCSGFEVPNGVAFGDSETESQCAGWIAAVNHRRFKVVRFHDPVTIIGWRVWTTRVEEIIERSSEPRLVSRTTCRITGLSTSAVSSAPYDASQCENVYLIDHGTSERLTLSAGDWMSLGASERNEVLSALECGAWPEWIDTHDLLSAKATDTTAKNIPVHRSGEANSRRIIRGVTGVVLFVLGMALILRTRRWKSVRTSSRERLNS